MRSRFTVSVRPYYPNIQILTTDPRNLKLQHQLLGILIHIDRQNKVPGNQCLRRLIRLGKALKNRIQPIL